MNPVAEEMRAILEGDEQALFHYGTKYHSGRYPWGSGENPHQHEGDFLNRIERLKSQGWTETAENIKKEFGEDVTLEAYRCEKSWATYTRRVQNVEKAKYLRDNRGMTPTQIGREMGVRESTVRGWFDEEAETRMHAAKATADIIKQRIEETGKPMVMLGAGVERELGVTKTNLDLAVYALESEGYEMRRFRYEQPTNWGKFTTYEALAKPGTASNAQYDPDNIASMKEYVSHDGGATFKKKFTYPESLDSSRLYIRYPDEGGDTKDGIVQLRRGVPDLSLGESHYSQVRIMVDGTHYIKGMAVYSDDMPDGVDVVFNTAKSRDAAVKGKVLKPLKTIITDDGREIIDPDNPFGSLIKDADQGGQYWYKDKDGKEKLGLINKRADEGDWNKWKDELSSQFLSKQPLPLIKKQLKQAVNETNEEYESIMAINNPTIRKYYLNKFADECDAAAVHLKGAALPGQKYHVILPIDSLKDNEVYAPQYEHGSEVVLVRYPHGGTFEIPRLKVNNKNPDAKSVVDPQSNDAICINHKVAARLSGADFDGDTVMCIPTKDAAGNTKVKIINRDPLPELQDFDPHVEYAKTPGMKYMKDPKTKKDNTQIEMGKISNLITDMTLAGAPDDELARAVKHSMVVIDAAKHELDYKRSEVENGIAALHKKWQGHIDPETGRLKTGAGTIVSRASAQKDVTKRLGSPKVNVEFNAQGKRNDWYDPSKPEGALIYKDDINGAYYPKSKYDKATKTTTLTLASGKKVSYRVDDPDERDRYEPVERVEKDGNIYFTNKTGDMLYRSGTRTQKSTRMAEVDNAYDLVSEMRWPKEEAYADYANTMKGMANRARKQAYSTGDIKYDKNAANTYQAEVSSLRAKLNTALLNQPRERYAIAKATGEINAKKRAEQARTGAKMKTGDLKKVSQKALSKYREEVGAIARSKRNIDITDREWEAIQAGAVSKTDLTKILNNTDPDQLRARATPKATNAISTAKQNRITNMAASGKTIAEIASSLGLSASTVNKYLNEKE